MINKKRLQKLIQQKATIYTWTDWAYEEKAFRNKVFTIKLRKGDEVIENCLFSYDHPIMALYCGIPLRILYETTEEMEFGPVVREDILELPLWDKFFNSGQSVKFRDKNGVERELRQYNQEIYIDNDYIGYLDRKNYDKARRKCIKLFLGKT